ncbi:class I SAM-dependent methyltransferase [Legionella dresdenensis]|uniref:Class I SAM-dependent methyltransferase n=1 Tax=Legionella dresdenensis TaxID=450200 RepID=A0ABV8CGR6_9GAMM
MTNLTWPADDYAIGSYIQATVADNYLSRLQLKPTHRVLDVGCGNGAYSRKILSRIPQGSLVGLDASPHMLKLARETLVDYPNVQFHCGDMAAMAFNNEFDYVVSFWCLQWSADIMASFRHIHQALKDSAKVFALFPTGDDPLMTMYEAVRNSGRFSSLDQFKLPINYAQFVNLEQKLAEFAFKSLKVERCQQLLELPSLDIYSKFVNGIPFYDKQISAQEIKKINQAMADAFEVYCHEHYNGKYLFEFSIYLVTAEK